jgi:hypothetical protein
VHDFPGGEWRRIQRAPGYRLVVVKGEVTIEDDRETGRHFGRLPPPRRDAMNAGPAATPESTTSSTQSR